MRLIGIILCLNLCTLAPAAGKPDFSGEWTLNQLRSEYGAQAAPKQMTQIIQHRDPRLHVTTIEVSPLDQEVRQEIEYKTDGEERASKVLGNDVKSTAKWDGDTLAIHSRSSFAGRTVDLRDRWRLIQDGKVLIIDRTIEGPAGKYSEVIVLDKK